MSDAVDMDKQTGVCIPNGHCPGNVNSYRRYSWHVAENTSPAVDTDPPSDPPPSIINDPYFSPHKCSLGTCCWHLCGNMAHGLPCSPQPDKQPSQPDVTIDDQFIHHDSIFECPSSAITSNYLIHPDWVSERLIRPKIYPLKRPPWPWEQPRHRINMQIPITYKLPETEPPRIPNPFRLPYTPPKSELEIIKEKWGLHY